MSNATTTLLSLSGAQLRAEPTNSAYVAELARRAAKRTAAGKAPVAEVFKRMAESVPAKAPKAPKATKVADLFSPELAPVIAKPLAPIGAAFTRTSEAVAAPKTAVAHLHNRVCNIEASLLALAAAAASQDALLREIIAKLTK